MLKFFIESGEHMDRVRVVFMGTPEFSVPILEMLIDNYNVVGVVTQPDKFVGRKKILTPSPIKQVAMKKNIPVLTPQKIRLEFNEILKLNPDIVVTCAFGQIVPKEILEFPKYGCINVHASLLPKYRGGAPIQRAIMAGEEKTGITIMYMDEGLDTGDMIESKEVIINDSDNCESLSNKLMICGTNLLKNVLPKILSNENTRTKQDDSKSIYAPIITRQDEKLDFEKNTKEIYNKIRALSPNPASYFILDSKITKVFASRIGNMNVKEKPGIVTNIYEDGIGISTLDGEIVIVDIKIEGKNRMIVKEYLNGKNQKELIGKGVD